MMKERQEKHDNFDVLRIGLKKNYQDRLKVLGEHEHEL